MKIVLTEAQYRSLQRGLIREERYFNIVKETAIEEKISLTESQIRTFSKILESYNGKSILSEDEDILSVLEDICVLSFKTENAKLSGGLIFSLPAGWSCPFADKCLKKVNRYRDMEKGEEGEEKGSVVWSRGKNTEFDCFAANQELQYDAVREGRWRNFDMLKSAEKSGGVNGMYELIKKSLEHAFYEHGKKNEVRIHESGDFYNQSYLDAWVKVAKDFPNVVFYAYTKSYPYFKKYMTGDDETSVDVGNNFIVTFSYGGKYDETVKGSNLKTSEIFKTPEDIRDAGMKIDLDDDLAKVSGGRNVSFALLLHGTQKAGINSQMKLRNETFINYWKYRPYLNRKFRKEDSHIWSAQEAEKFIVPIKNELTSRKTDKGQKSNLKVSTAELEGLLKQLNYVVKYEKYNFPTDLIEILPDNYKP